MLVIGATNSSNSLRLAEVAERLNVPARLIQRAADIDWDWLGQPGTIGLTAGASAPEVLVREVVDALRERFDVTEEEAAHVNEGMSSSCRASSSPDVSRTARSRDFHRRRLQGQSRARRLGRGAAHRAASERELSGGEAADDQQPHGIDGRDRIARTR